MAGKIVARVMPDAVADLPCKVEPVPVVLEHLDDPERLHVVLVARDQQRVPRRDLREALGERRLAGVTEGRVAEVVAERDRLGEVFVEPERAGDRAGDLRDLKRVRKACAVVVAFGRKKHLRLMRQATERLAVNDAVAVPLELCPERVEFERAYASARGICERRAVREARALLGLCKFSRENSVVQTRTPVTE